jgi:hypothetical protein
MTGYPGPFIEVFSVYCFLQRNLRQSRMLLLLPLLISQLMFWYAIDHQHAVNSYYDQNDPRHSFTQVNLSRMKAVKHTAPQKAPTSPATLTPDTTPGAAPDTALQQSPEPPAIASSHHIASCPNRAPPTST